MKRNLLIAVLILLLFLTGCQPAHISTRQGLTADSIVHTDSEIRFLDAPSVTKRGETASVTVKAPPNTLCDIAVHLSSGTSKAKGLEPKKSDENGTVTWTWTVGTQTAPGQYRIAVSGGGLVEDIYFVVE